MDFDFFITEEERERRKKNEECRKRRRVKTCKECLRYYECFPHKYKGERK